MTDATPPKDAKRYLFDNPRNVRLLLVALYVACIVVFVADAFVDRHVDHPWERLFGFYGVFGFIAFVALVLSAKELRKVLMRKEDYYDE
jgi:hypothetical protein